MRLAFDCTYALSPPTGIGTFATAVLQRLRRRPDIDVVGYAVAWRQVDDVTGALDKLLDDGVGGNGGGGNGAGGNGRRGDNAVRVPRRTALLHPRYARAAWKRSDQPAIEFFTGPVDVVHGPNYVLPPTLRAASVVTVHDLTMIRYPEFSTADTLAFPALMRRSVDRGAWIHTDTQAVATEVIETFGANPDRVRCVPLAFDAVPDADPTRGAELAGSERYVLALGTVEPRKNLPRLVAAFDRVADDDPDLHLVLAGSPGWGSDALEGSMIGIRHADRVRMPGWVSASDRAALLRGAAVLAYPSLYEGFGIPPLEAMSVGTPVVAGAVAAVTEVCGDAAEFVDPLDIADIARGLHTVLTNDARRAELVTAGVDQAAAYSWDRTAAGLATLYGDAIADRKARR